MKFYFKGLPAWLVFTFAFLHAGQLTKENYLGQVRAGNLLVKSLLEGADSDLKLTEEKELLTMPAIFSELQHAQDRSPSAESFLTGDNRLFDKLAFGVERRTDLGLSGRISYDVSHYSLEGIRPITIMPGVPPFSLIGTPKYYSNKLAAELKLDLLRNSFGREVKSSQKALISKYEASHFEKTFRVRQVLSQAGITYWQLALARETVKIHEQLLERANRLDAWMQGQIKLNLQDGSEINQSRSEVQLRKLELAGAWDSEKSASRAFNVLRGTDTGLVAEALDLPGEKDLMFDAPFFEPEKREDVISLYRSLEASKSGAFSKKEVFYPELSIGLSAALNGQDSGFSKSFSDSVWSDKYFYGVGLNFRMPFGLPAGKLSEAYDLEWKSLEKYIGSKRLELLAERDELVRKLADARNRLMMAEELENLQRNKVEAERDRLNKGNSVTYQVIMFEQDWSKSQLSVIEIKKGILEIIARLKLFNAGEGL